MFSPSPGLRRVPRMVVMVGQTQGVHNHVISFLGLCMHCRILVWWLGVDEKLLRVSEEYGMVGFLRALSACRHPGLSVHAPRPKDVSYGEKKRLSRTLHTAIMSDFRWILTFHLKSIRMTDFQAYQAFASWDFSPFSAQKWYAGSDLVWVPR